jgi:uncharacterized membrane protein YkvA (DUF1232 family)
MGLRVTFELEDKDLRFFKNNMKKAKETATAISDDEIIAKAEGMVDEVKSSNVPAFVLERIGKLNSLIDMLRDEEWSLEGAERKNVLAALSYFADPQDIIPDNVPVIGYIDDAIMIELVVKELQHEIDAFADFCKYRSDERTRNRNPNLSREEYLAIKRRELHGRMRRRRTSGRRRSGAGRRTRFRLF